MTTLLTPVAFVHQLGALVDLRQRVICVIIGSISIQRSIYQSTIFGSSISPRAPPNADLFRINEMRIAEVRPMLLVVVDGEPMIMSE